MILQSGREIPDCVYEAILDKIIDSIVIEYATLGFEDFMGAVIHTTESLQRDEGWLPDSNVFNYEEAIELVNTVEIAARYFANDLSDTYSNLKEKYIGTKSWELFK